MDCENLDHKILTDKVKNIGFSEKKMVSLLPHKLSLIQFIRQCILESMDHKLWSSSKVYIRTSLVFAIYK